MENMPKPTTATEPGSLGNPFGAKTPQTRMRYNWQTGKYEPNPAYVAPPATKGATVRLKSGS